MPASAAESAAETDAGPRDRAAATERLCIATRTVKPIQDLLRFVVDPDGMAIPDLKRRLPGRGVWVTANRRSLAAAVARNAFARGFKRQVGIAADLVAVTEALLERAVLDALGIANKAGLVEIGFSRVEAALREGRTVALLRAKEASADGARKLAGVARRAGMEEPAPPVIVFTGPQLDLALGRSNVIHAALLAGPASEALLARYRVLDRFRDGEPAELAEKDAAAACRSRT
jgi:predicted RNA-binding protein YlxR (DUF448 family)